MGIPEGEEEQEIENIFEKVMTENYPNLMREKVMQVQKAQRVSIPKRPTLGHIIIEMSKFKDKERNVKTAREKQIVTYKGVWMRQVTDFSTETLQVRREWQKIFQAMKTNGL